MQVGSANNEAERVRPTIFESMLIASHMPYVLAIVLIAAFIGPLGNFLFLFSSSGDALRAIDGAFLSLNAGEAGFIAASQFDWYSLAGNILWYAFLFYVVLIARNLRMRLIRTIPDLVSLAPDGEATVQRIFGHVSRAFPQLAIASIFLLVYATAVPDLLSHGQFTIISGPIYVLRSLLRSLLFGSVLWLYCGSLWGLYLFGKQKLRLKSYRDDSLLGTKKLGSLASSFSLMYFLALILFGAQMTLGAREGQAALVNVVAMLILVPVGIALFVAPLATTHSRMLAVKRTEIAETGRLLSELFHRSSEPDQKNEQRMIELMTLEATERKVMSIRTWPVESPLIGKLALISISVAATLIARLIQIVLKI